MTPRATLGVEQFAGEAEPVGIASGGPIASLLKTADATALTLASVLPPGLHVRTVRRSS